MTDNFAKLVAISLVYRIMLILFGSLLVPVVILCALSLAVIGAFVALAVTGHALDLSASIGMPMLIDIVVTNAIVLHEIEAGADVRAELLQGGRTRVRPILMTAAAMILALIPLALSSGGLIVASLTTDWEGSRPMNGPLAAKPTNVVTRPVC